MPFCLEIMQQVAEMDSRMRKRDSVTCYLKVCPMQRPMKGLVSIWHTCVISRQVIGLDGVATVAQPFYCPVRIAWLCLQCSRLPGIVCTITAVILEVEKRYSWYTVCNRTVQHRMYRMWYTTLEKLL